MDQPSRQDASPNRKIWLGAFVHPAFAVVWAASTIALIGIAMYDTASGWLMTTLDLNPFDVSLVHAATNLPMFLFTLPAGAIADIVDPAPAHPGGVVRDRRPDRDLSPDSCRSTSPRPFCCC